MHVHVQLQDALQTLALGQSGVGAIQANPPGTGKTLIKLIVALVSYTTNNIPSLVIAQSSHVEQWVDEIVKWLVVFGGGDVFVTLFVVFVLVGSDDAAGVGVCFVHRWCLQYVFFC